MPLKKYLPIVISILVFGSLFSTQPIFPQQPEQFPISSRADIPITIQLDRPKAVNLTDEDLKALASKYEGISDRMSNLSLTQISRLHELKPNLQIIRYINFSAVYGQERIKKALKLNPNIALRDKSGNLEPSLWEDKKGFCADPANQEWRNHLIEQCYEAVTKKGYDGIMADEVVMVNRLSADFGGINPKTGRVYTTEEYRGAQYKTLKAVKEKIGKGKLLIANSVAYGAKYYEENPQRFFEVIDGVVAEGFRGNANWPVDKYFSEEDWKKDLDMLIDVQSREKYITALVKYMKELVANEVKKKQANLFWLGTFLLGKGDFSSFASSIHDRRDISASDKSFNPIWSTRTGKPLAPYYKKDGVYQRDFEKAKVVVNPSARSFSIKLDQEYKTLDGRTVSALDLKPHTAEILMRP